MSDRPPRPKIEMTDSDSDIFRGDESKPARSRFPKTYRRETPEELADRYRSTHGHRAAKSGAGEAEGLNLFDRARAQLDTIEPRVRQGSTLFNSGLGKGFIFASLAASLTGGLIGLVATQFDDIRQTTSNFAAGVLDDPRPQQSSAAPMPVVVANTVIARKAVATPTLEVADTGGALNSMIPLILRAEPAVEGQTLALRVSGLPEDAYLTAGSRVSPSSWQLNPGQEKDVKLVVPTASSASFDVEVAAIETATGELAAPAKAVTVAIDETNLQVEPASAPPETAIIHEAAGQRQDLPQSLSSEADYLLDKGDQLLKFGDLGAARQFYEQAYALGSATGAIGAGKTYDPIFFAEINVQGVAADPVKALEWYKRAEARGAADATAAIDALKALAN